MAPGAHAVLVLDGAGWHRGGELIVPANISLLELPPYAPELNPVENIWQFLRANWLAISVFDDYHAIVDACCDAWNRFADHPQTVTSISQRAWQRSIERAIGMAAFHTLSIRIPYRPNRC